MAGAGHHNRRHHACSVHTCLRRGVDVSATWSRLCLCSCLCSAARTRLQRGEDAPCSVARTRPQQGPTRADFRAVAWQLAAFKPQQHRAQRRKNPLSVGFGKPCCHDPAASHRSRAGSELAWGLAEHRPWQDPGAGSALLCSLSPQCGRGTGLGGPFGTPPLPPCLPGRAGDAATLRGDELLCRQSDVLQLPLFMEQNDSHGTTPDFLSI